MTTELPETSGYGRVPVLISAVVGIAVAVLSVWWASGFAVFYEELFRVTPTVQDGGVGADWLAGNTIPWLDFLVALTHAADAIMGLFILFMVFLHWAAFRRLAGRMRQPGETGAEGVATDGGEASGSSQGSSEVRSDGGEASREGRGPSGRSSGQRGGVSASNETAEPSRGPRDDDASRGSSEVRSVGGKSNSGDSGGGRQ